MLRGAKPPHGRPFDRRVLEIAGHRHLVARQRLEPMLREIAPSGIADEDEGAAAAKPSQPRGDPLGRFPLIPDVADEPGVPALLASDEILEPRLDRNAVRACVEADRLGSEGIDVAGLDHGRAGLRRRYGDQPRARSEIEHAAAGDKFPAIEHVARQRLSASPGERPERRLQPELAELLFGLEPQLRRFIREKEADLRGIRDGKEPRVRPDESGTIGTSSRLPALLRTLEVCYINV